MDMRLELVPLPTSDVDASKAFYTDGMGFVLDHDVEPGNGMRVVQLTPPGSSCSIVIGVGMSDPDGPRVQNLHLVVDDIEAAHAFLEERGVESSGPQHFLDGAMTPGVEPDRADYGTFIYFDDPDGNTWAVQEVKHHAR